MRILFASSEAYPFSKTGGLGDVSSALCRALSQAGHDVILVTPHYPRMIAKGGARVPAISHDGIPIEIRINDSVVKGRLLESQLADSNARVFLVEQPYYFDRPGPYGDGQRDYRDNCERFVFFCRAVLETARQLDWRPDIIHANDWQTGLLPALFQIESRFEPTFDHAASIFTIHNMAFQGQFWHWDVLLTGLDWKYFNWHQMEFFGNLNLLKTGIVFCDLLTTVSPTYAREIQTAEFGEGLQGVVSTRRNDLVGILNGIDTDDWNPATDRFLAMNYNAETVREGKAACKAALQSRMGLPLRPDVPLVGMVSRITSQKGFDLLADRRRELLSFDAQYVFLGTGDPYYEDFVRGICQEAPEKVAATIGFDEELSHQIEAGADVFLMPSRFEPCGLNQMYSLQYGTVPVVRAVGGLADSVVDVNNETLANETATGFRFHDYRSDELIRTLARALGHYRDGAIWSQLIRTGMQRDWSWRRSAEDYVAIYQRAIAKRRAGNLLVVN